LTATKTISETTAPTSLLVGEKGYSLCVGFTFNSSFAHGFERRKFAWVGGGARSFQPDSPASKLVGVFENKVAFGSFQPDSPTSKLVGVFATVTRQVIQECVMFLLVFEKIP
jgi:hypothetical protein